MSDFRSDRLWPVLTVTALVLGGAAWVEVVTSPRHVEEVVVTIDASTGDLSGEDEDGGEAPTGAPLDATHEAARVASRRGDLDEAIRLFGEASAAHPEAGRLRGELGYWLLAADRDPEALAVLEEARALAPTDAWVALTLGRARQHADDLAGAEAAYREALAARPGYSSAEVALGIVLRRQGRVDEAIGVLETASRSGGNEDRGRALAALGRAYLEAGRREDAAQAFDAAVAQAPASVEIRLTVARGWLSDGQDADVPTALTALEETARMAPDVPQVHSSLGRAHERLSDPRAAEAAYREALRLDPSYVYPRRRLLQLALDEDDLSQAEAQVATLLEQQPDDPENELLAGLVAARKDDPEEARRHYRRALELTHDDYPEAWFNLGLLEKKAGRLDEAIAAYQAALALRPDYASAQNNLGLAYEAADRPAEAEATWRALIERDPTYAGAWQNLGDLLQHQKRYDEAIACYQAALAADPHHVKAALNLGVTFSRAGRTDDAIATYRALLADNPRYVTAWYNMGLALDDANDTAGAREALEQAVALDPDHRSAKRSLARLEAGDGHLDVAASLYEDLLDRDPADTKTRLSYARILARQGDAAGCEREARFVLSADPGDAKATTALGRCKASPSAVAVEEG